MALDIGYTAPHDVCVALGIAGVTGLKE